MLKKICFSCLVLVLTCFAARAHEVPAGDTLVVAGGLVVEADSIITAQSAPEQLTEQQARELENYRVRRLELLYQKDTLSEERKDTLSISRMALLSLPLPGFSQIYNKQYWKLPVLYGAVGGLTYLGIDARKSYNDYTRQYDDARDAGAGDSELEALDKKRKSYRSQSTLYYVGAGITYLYFVGDGVFNYPYSVKPAKRATTLSMLCPGAGQVYNGAYWKVPIVYGGFALMGFIIDWNNRGYQRYRTAYRLLTDDDPETVDEFGGRYSADVLRNTRNAFRRNRDLSIIVTAGWYVLQVIDAHVDSYLRTFDVSDDLTMRVEPYMFNTNTLTAGSKPGFGLNVSLSF